MSETLPRTSDAPRPLRVFKAPIGAGRPERRAASPSPGTRAALLVAIDGLAAIEAALGQEPVQVLLLLVEKRLLSVVRECDLARPSGPGEIAVVVSHIPDRPGLSALAARLTAVLSRPYLVDGYLLTIRARIGTALAAGEQDDTALVQMAQADLPGRSHE